MFISPAFAQGAPGAGGMGFLTQLIPILLMFLIFYLIVFRPQQQKMKAHREMVMAVKRGDTVVTAGGIVGKVSKVIDDDYVQVEIADDTRVKLVKATLAEVRVKGEPTKA